MANLKRQIDKDQAKADELKLLKARIKAKDKLLDQYEKQIEDLRKAKYRLPKSRKSRSSKADYVRLVVPDTHGCFADLQALRAFLDDARSLAADEPYVCKTVGFLIAEQRIGTPQHTIYLTMTDGGDEVGPQIEIPVKTITSRREIDVKGRNSEEC